MLPDLTAKQQQVLRRALSVHAGVLWAGHFDTHLVQLIRSMEESALNHALQQLRFMPAWKLQDVRHLPSYLMAYFARIHKAA